MRTALRTWLSLPTNSGSSLPAWIAGFSSGRCHERSEAHRMRGDTERRARDEGWTFESAVESALVWLARSALALWSRKKAVRISGYAAAGALILAGTVVAGTQAHHYARKQVQNRHEQIPVGP